MNESNGSKNQVLTIKEVSHYLRIPASTVYDLARAGKIKGRKFGKHWRFLEEVIASYFHGISLPSIPPATSYERRQHFRLNARMRAEIVTLLFVRTISVKGTIHNLSAGGVYFVADTSAAVSQPEAGTGACELFEAGDPVGIMLELPDEVPARIQCRGRIVHQLLNGRMGSGIKFKNLKTRETELIQNYVG